MNLPVARTGLPGEDIFFDPRAQEYRHCPEFKTALERKLQ
jgi:hypothetical protein